MGGATAILAAAEDGRIRAIVAEGSFAELEDEVGVGMEGLARPGTVVGGGFEAVGGDVRDDGNWVARSGV